MHGITARRPRSKGGVMNPLNSFIGRLSVIALALMVPTAVAIAAPPSDSTTIAKLLQQAKTDAALANEDAEFLVSNAQSNLDPRMHAQYLRMVREHAAELFRDYYQLQAIQNKGTPQQRAAIDRLDPLLRDMATSLTTTLQTFNSHPARSNMPYFRTRIRGDWESINKVYELLCECTSQNKKS